MICRLLPSEFDAILNVVNDAAQAYKGVIPQDRWKEPYMPASELEQEIASGRRILRLERKRRFNRDYGHPTCQRCYFD